MHHESDPLKRKHTTKAQPKHNDNDNDNDNDNNDNDNDNDHDHDIDHDNDHDHDHDHDDTQQHNTGINTTCTTEHNQHIRSTSSNTGA
jgi:ABC-type Zn2+ transport system substrate-binding protein/surface adhesin